MLTLTFWQVHSVLQLKWRPTNAKVKNEWSYPPYKPYIPPWRRQVQLYLTAIAVMKTDVSDSGGTEVGQFGIQTVKCDEYRQWSVTNTGSEVWRIQTVKCDEYRQWSVTNTDSEVWRIQTVKCDDCSQLSSLCYTELWVEFTLSY